jgi:hypothetical protein
MTKQVFLHIGAHKTGTTTLQAELASNRSVLENVGLVYPDLNGLESHFEWARFLAGEVTSLSELQHNQATTKWLNNLKPDQSLLLSAESFYRLIHTQNDYISKDKYAFNNTNITPVLCLRMQADYAKSLYSEWVTNWQYQYDIYILLLMSSTVGLIMNA